MGIREYMKQLTAENAAKCAVRDAARARAAHVLPAQRDAELVSAAVRIAAIRAELDCECAFADELRAIPDDGAEYKQAYEAARKRFGYVPAPEFFEGGKTCRVWYRDWHYMDGASSGTIGAQGFSPLDALRRVLVLADSYEHVAHGPSYGCDHCDKHGGLD